MVLYDLIPNNKGTILQVAQVKDVQQLFLEVEMVNTQQDTANMDHEDLHDLVLDSLLYVDHNILDSDVVLISHDDDMDLVLCDHSN